MEKKFKHLSLEEREKLFAWKECGLSFRAIARKLSRSHSSIVREWKRGTKYGKKYLPCMSQRRAERVGRKQRVRARLKDPLTFLYVNQHLKEDLWSPEQIAGRLPLDHPGETICHETIYQYVYNPPQKRAKLYRYLALHRKRRMKKNGRKVKEYTKLTKAVPIGKRPQEINDRQELGHWESDNMEGKKSDATSVSVSVERVSRLIRIRKLVGHTGAVKTAALIQHLMAEDERLRKSITVDRGPENSGYEEVQKATGVDFYACEPYHSWEKGSVENGVGRVRRFIPKGTTVDVITEGYVQLLEEKMNNTPRKCLGFLTPNEYLKKTLNV